MFFFLQIHAEKALATSRCDDNKVHSSRFWFSLSLSAPLNECVSSYR